MSINPISTDPLAEFRNTNPSSNTSQVDQDFDPDLFLKLLTAQLSNQSPFDTADTNQIIEQQSLMAQTEQINKQTVAIDNIHNLIKTELATLNTSIASIAGSLNQGGNE